MKKTLLATVITMAAFGANAFTLDKADTDTLDRLAGYGITQSNWDDGEFTSLTFIDSHRLLNHATMYPAKQGRTFEKSSRALDMSAPVQDVDGFELTIEELLRDRLHNRTMVVLQDGKLVHEHYWSGTNKDTLQLAQSVTKSFASSLAAIAQEEGYLKFSDPIDKYLPEAKGTVIEGQPLQYALDMRTGFGLIDADNQNAYASDWDMSMAKAIGWYGEPTDWVGVQEYTKHLNKTAYEAGKKYEYHSYNTEVLGLITARATDQHWSQYFEDKIWKQGGFNSKATIFVGKDDQPMACGGLSMTTRDAATMGDIWAHDGKAQDGTQVIPKTFLDGIWAGDKEVKAAWALGKEAALADGFYKDQFRILNLDGKPWMVGIGVHGQILAVEKESKTVVAMFGNYNVASSARFAVDGFHTALPTILNNIR
ncbi:beta-lactamase family protein [Endozoicomonas gorgoniicola]|uniref:Beta-lactamase family protein n=1 Tax=Endozoicomonas gorgoniicola TaxID=1234144 RepID=A0ABT3MXS4_9GAMM|nr:serine hydrolase [Endozoicomonas gorgoniicola]MCW7554178.1 beta-lactamase family protein [Endozoicomonas gorgoniicola]